MICVQKKGRQQAANRRLVLFYIYVQTLKKDSTLLVESHFTFIQFELSLCVVAC